MGDNIEVYRYDYTTEEQARRVFERAHKLSEVGSRASFWLTKIVSEPGEPWSVIVVDEVGVGPEMDWEDGVRGTLDEPTSRAFMLRRLEAISGSLGPFHEGELRDTITPGTPVQIGDDGEWVEDLDDFGKFLERIKLGVRREFGAFDEKVLDFNAKVILEAPDGSLLFTEVGHLLQSPSEKVRLGEQVMPHLIRHHEASRAAFLSSSIMVTIGDDGEMSKEEASRWRDEHGDWEGAPGAVECLIAWVADFTGTFTQLTAPIIREEGKPIRLGGWTTRPDGWRLDGSNRQQWHDEQKPGDEWPILQGDAMNALMGAPTSPEVRAAIKVLAHDPTYCARIDEAIEALGLPHDISNADLMEHGEEVLAKMREDEGFEAWFRERVAEMLGTQPIKG